MKTKLILAVSAILALGSTQNIAATMDVGTPQNMEKCYGIAKAGNNDCGTESNYCAGEAKVDSDPAAWMFVPDGLCKRIAGGKMTPPPPKKA